MSIEDFPSHRSRDYVTNVVVCLFMISLVGPSVMAADMPHIHQTSSVTAIDFYIHYPLS